MSTFANVNIGVTAGDGTGDPLRLAFTKINTNFANITNGQITASNIAYTAANNANWNYTVTNVQDALDQIAYRLKQAGF